MSNLYYREKLVKLVLKLFSDPGDAKTRLINNEIHLDTAYLASKSLKLPQSVDKQWEKIWVELHSKQDFMLSKGISEPSLAFSLSGKHNKSLTKYYDFFMEEFLRVLE